MGEEGGKKWFFRWGKGEGEKGKEAGKKGGDDEGV